MGAEEDRRRKAVEAEEGAVRCGINVRRNPEKAGRPCFCVAVPRP